MPDPLEWVEQLTGGRVTRAERLRGGLDLRDAAGPGVVDWVETSWGPADLDVAHCSTALALLHGVDAGVTFSTLYAEAGGRTLADHRYWRVLDALAFAPDAEKVAAPWRELGRTDLTPALLQDRLELYLESILRVCVPTDRT